MPIHAHTEPGFWLLVGSPALAEAARSPDRQEPGLPLGAARTLGLHTTWSSRVPITWVVVKIMVPFWLLVVIRPLVFRGPKSGS